MVILSAQDSDANINKVTLSFFKRYPNVNSLTKTSIEEITSYLTSVKKYLNKAKWILETAHISQCDENILTNLNHLITLKGIGRKSANVVLRETNQKPEGIIVDLHVIRVAPRIGGYPQNHKTAIRLKNYSCSNLLTKFGMQLECLFPF